MNLQILDLDRDTIHYYKDCFDNNGDPKDMKSLEWQFFENKTPIPFFVDIAYDNEVKRTAAIYATFSIGVKIDDDNRIACQSFDTITDIEYRGKGLYTKLAANVFKKGTESGLAFVYGFPNGNSIHGFASKHNWIIMDPVPFLIRPLKTQYFTKKIKGLGFLPNVNLWNPFTRTKVKKGFTIRCEKAFPNAVNNLWINFSKNIGVAVNRNKAYLDWRYIQKPLENYCIAHCYNGENEYSGFIVYCIKEKHNGKIAYIMELIYDLNFPASGQELLKFAMLQIRKNNADCILSWCFKHAPNYNVFKNALFLNMSEKIRPIELHFGCKAYDKTVEKTISKRTNWYISYSDSDTV